MARFSVRRRSGGNDGGGGGGGGGWFGRIFMALFGLAFLAGGVVFFYFMAQSVWAGLETRAWEEVPCTILESTVVVPEADGGGDGGTARGHRLELNYEWRWEGARFTGDRLRRGLVAEDGLADVYRRAWIYPAGSVQTCRVDPGAPERAVLEQSSPWAVLTLAFPLLFAGVGLVVLALPFYRRRRGERRAVTTGASNPLEKTGCLVGFFLIFAVAGLGFFVPFFGIPLARTLAAGDWLEVPATVLSSEVGSHHSDDGTTYSVDIVYRYEVDGRELRSDRYDLLSGSSSGYEGKAEIVEGYPPGTETVAWVDPEEPWNAVLSRDLRGEWWFALLPLVFVVVGVGGATFTLVGRWRLKAREAAGIESWRPDGPSPEERRRSTGPQVLEPGTTPLGKLAGIVFFATVWNGIVGVFVWFWWQESRTGSPDGCLTLFLIPFVLVGILLLVSVPYQVLASFNPRPVLTLDRRRLEPGTTTTLQWSFRGRGERIRHLKIELEGREEATYRMGTNTRTDKETFFHRVLADTGMETARGSAELALPEDTMHSFEAPNNKIVWVLKIHGTIDRWPDVADEFPVVVEPRRVEP